MSSNMLKLQKIILEKRYISVAMSEYDDFQGMSKE